MKKVICLQLGATAFTVLMAGLLVGTRGAVSAGLAGMALILPNFWFALRLKAAAANGKGLPLAARFFIGEFIKVAASVGLLFIVVKTCPNLHWPSLLVGVIAVSQANFLAFWKKS
jgi:ATP synthase protein I